MDWAWVWTAFTILLAVGEAVTAGFYLLPFAAGALTAAIVGWVWGDSGGVGIIALEWLLFFVVSFLALLATRLYMKKQDRQELPTVGANRFRDVKAWVIADIDRFGEAGSVRVDGEEWRAATDGDPIAAGTLVRVLEVRGTRLIVEPFSDQPNNAQNEDLSMEIPHPRDEGNT